MTTISATVNRPFRVSAFGSLVIRSDVGSVEVSPGIASAIVARLALSAGQTLTTERLISSLWDTPPTNAAGSLRVYVSRLRAGPLGAILHGGRGGYLLDVDREKVDVLRFESLVEAERYEEALRVWSAEPFGTLGAFPFVKEARAGLAERRFLAVERVTNLRIQRGEAAVSILELTPLVARNPLHEGLVASLALAYAAEGRVTDALAVLDRSRDVLRDTGGLDPSARMDALRQSILRQDPALGTAAAREHQVERHAIPVPLTRLFGREKELQRIEQARSAHRLVSLVGPGGVGKTRLAIESARRSTRTIDAEQWMVDLSRVAPGGDVLAAAADALGAISHSLEAIAARLQGRATLLILDNAEHVVRETRNLVGGLLAHCDGLAVIATSREPLGIAGEFIIRVPGLIGESSERAVELFRERSAAARGGAEGSPEEMATIRRLCRLLDGLPLALELAAARTDVLSVGELTRALDRGEHLTSDSPAGERHASLDSTIRWSTDNLEEEEFALLVELSNFAGSFTLEAIDSICRSGTRPAREIALALARKSLVAVDETETGRRMYRLLESMRAFARPRRDAQESAAWYVRHTGYFADLADRLAPTIRTHDAPAAHAALDALAADFQLATEHAIEEGDRDTALRLAGGQAWHWFKRGWLVEGRSVIDRALAIPGGSDPAIEARALVGVVNLAYQSGDAEAAFEYVRIGLERATAGGDTLAAASLLAYVAYGRSLFGDPDEAEGLIDQATAWAADAPDWLRAEVLMSRGQTLRALGRPSEALDSLAEARKLAESSGHAWARSSSEYVAGKILIEVRRSREAIPLLVRGAQTAAAGGDIPGALALLHLAGGASAFVERHADGATVFGAVDAIGRRYSYNPVVAEGADAQVHRDRVASGLLPRDFEAAYQRGTGLSLGELLNLSTGLVKAR
jgi:predicted ATPase/DNA-binding SARP family transcriptional activator